MKVDTTVCFVVLLALFAFHEVEAHNNRHRGWRNNLNRRFDIGYALRFDGDDFVTVPSFELGTPISFEFLYRVGPSGGGTLFSFQSGSAYLRLSLTRATNGFGAFQLEVGQPNNQGQVQPRSFNTSSVFPKNNRWQYVVVIFRHNGQVQFYLEEDEASVLKTTNQASIGTSLNWRTFTNNFIGRRADDNNPSYFLGDLDEVRFWTKELSATDDRDRTREIDPSNQRSLQAWYNFNQGLGLIATDVAFKGKDGVLAENTNTPQWIVAGFTATRTCKIFGDPNVKTFDRRCFRIASNRVGDFWLVDREPSYGIQVRLATKPGSSSSTAVIGLAFQTVDRWVVIDLDFRSKSDSVLTVDNIIVPTGTYIDNTLSVIKNWENNNKHTYEIEAPFAFSAKITAFPRSKYSEITVRIISEGSQGAVSGICGNFNGNGNDDTDTTSWPVDEEDNLFLGPTDLGTPDENYDCDIDTNPFIPPETVTRAHQICGDPAIVQTYLEDSCLYDVCSTGDIGAAYGSAELSYFDCIEENPNATAAECPRPCPNFCSFQGTCNPATGVCSCLPNQFGVDCSQTRNYRCFSSSWSGRQKELASFGGLASAANHYRYSTTYGFSSDTGKELSDTTIAYIYEQKPFGAPSRSSLVFINDKPRDGSGGRARVDFALDRGFTNTTLQISPRDDPDDQFITSSFRSNGRFTAEWNWWSCCTDGLVLGPLPDNFCVDMNMLVRDGISQVAVSSDNMFGTQDIFRVDSNSFQICGAQCNNTCGVYSDCNACTADPECGWCVETDTCELGSAAGPDRGRCNLWRYASDSTTSRVTKTTIGFPVDPSNIELFVRPAGTAQANFFVFFPASNLLPIDIALLVDLTRSASFELSYLQSATAASFSNILRSYPQARLAIGSFSDRPEFGFGTPGQGDIAYAENLAFTDNLVHIQIALNNLSPKDGLDNTNSQLEALQKAAASTTLAWRTSSMRIVVIVTKTLPHLPPSGAYANPALDYPSVEDVRNTLIAKNVIPVFVVPHTIANDYQNYVNAIGFGYVSRIVDGNIGSIYATVLDTVTSITQSVRAIPVPGQNAIFDATPVYPAAGYTGISPGTRVQFTANLVHNSTTSTGTILIPGFGTVNFKLINSDLPYLVGVPPTLSVTAGSAPTIITLETAGYYSSGDIQVLSLPASATLFQVNQGNRGPAITVNGFVTDPQNRIWVEFGSGSGSFVFSVVDGCRASSQNYTVSITVTGSNQNPTASGQSLSTNEEVNLPITLGGNDPDGNLPLTFWITTLPDSTLASLRSGVNTINSVPFQLPANSVTLVPALDRFGNVSFNFRVVDSLGAPSSDATIFVAINGVNDSPVAISTAVTVAEDSNVLVTLAGTDSWGETLPQNLVRVLVDPPVYGILSLTVGGSTLLAGPIGTTSAIYYIPNPNYNGPDSFTFFVRDEGNLPSNTATVGITVTAMNDPPQSSQQTFQGVEDGNVTIVLQGNDIDNAASSLRAVICSWNGVGTLYDGNNVVPKPSTNYVVQSTSRTLLYSPLANANGQPVTSFTFRITDPAGASSACFTANINVLAANDAPVAIPPTTVYVNESQTVQIVLRGYDVDTTDHPLTFLLCPGAPVQGLGTLGASTLVQVDMSQSIISYTAPSIGAFSTSFSFQVRDERTPNPPAITSACQTVDIVVSNLNDPPIANADAFSGPEDTDVPITLSGFDVDGDTLQYSVQSLPTVGALWVANDSFQKISQITATPFGLGTNNKLVYVPPPNANSNSPLTSFTFAVSDGSLFSQPAVIAISITPVNDAPVASPFVVSTYMNTDVIISSFVALDVDNETNQLSFYVDPSGITGELFSCADLICSSPVQIFSETLVSSGIVLYRPATGAFSPANQTFESFYYKAFDGLNSSASVPVGVVIFFVNSPPEASAQPDNITTDAGECIQLQINSTDPDGDNVQTFVLWSDFVGRLFQNNNGTLGDEILENGTAVTDPEGYIWYCAPQNPGGRDPITQTSLLFQAKDERGAPSNLVTVSVGIRRPPPAPIATTTGRLIPEDTRLDIVLGGSDSSRPSETFTCFLASLPANGTLFYSGGAAITGPILTPLQLPVCTVDFQASANENGNAYTSFRYFVKGNTSQRNSSEATVVIDISPVPDAPIPNTPRPSTYEDEPLDFEFLVADPDIGRPTDSFTITFTAVTSSGTLHKLILPSMTLGDQITVGSTLTSPNLWVRYTPVPNFQGVDSLLYTLVDSYLLSAGELNLPIDVISRNDPPVGIFTNNTGQNNIMTSNILIRVSDVDTAPAAISIFFTELPLRGTLYANAVLPANEVSLNTPYPTFNFKYVIDTPFEFGPDYDSFKWRAFDGFDFSDENTDVISILYINTPPTITSPTSYITSEDQQFQITLTATDPDVSQTVAFVIYNAPSRGTLLRSDGVTPLASSYPVLVPNPSIIFYRPTANVNTFGTVDDSFQIEARDIDPNPSKPFVYVRIIAVNDAPIINVPTSIPVNSGETGQTNGISFSDDASENPAAVVSVNVTSVGASSLDFVDPSGITGYTGPATSFVLSGTLAAFNQVFSRNILFTSDGSSVASLTVSIDDLGSNDATGTPTLHGVITETIPVEVIGDIGIEAGFIGIAGLLSGAVFGAYKYMKKKKLIPEEADPWENDELFDMTLDNPLYSGTSPSSLEAVFDKN